MLQSLQMLAVPAVLQRLTLLLNHLLGAEPAAMDRLRPHAGRRIRVQLAGWPRLLPRPPVLAFLVTRAGLLEWEPEGPAAAEVDGVRIGADLDVVVDAANPARMLLGGLGGERPRVDIAGDAAFAGDVNWLFENLRWDAEDDLARVVGVMPARELCRVGGWIAGALREAGRVAARVVPERGPLRGAASNGNR